MNDTAAQLPGWLRETRVALRSHDHMVRADTLRELLGRVRRDPASHVAALPLFREALESEIVPWALGYAAQGIEAIVDAAEAQAMWRRLLDRQDARQVSYFVIAMDKAGHVPLLLEVLQRRTEPEVRLNAVNMLGRSRDPRALPAIMAELQSSEVRPFAVAALGDLGDATAIPAIEAYQSDRSPAWPVDNHGPMLSVGDVAKEALQKLRTGRVTKPAGALPASADGWSASGVSVAAASSGSGLLTPGWMRLVAFAPLALVIFEIIWIFEVFSHDSAKPRLRERTAAEVRSLTMVASLPVLLGAAIGVVALWRGWATRWFERGAAVVGVLGCAAFLVQLAREWMSVWR